MASLIADLNVISGNSGSGGISALRRAHYAAKYAKNPQILAKKINAVLAKEGFLDEIIVNRFATGGASSGKAWPNLSKATIGQRKRQGFAAGPTLVRSGRLQKAAVNGKTTFDDEFVTKLFKDGPAPVYTGKGKSKNSKGSNGQKARQLSSFAYALHFGSPRKRIPARSFYAEPSTNEMTPMIARRDELIGRIVQEIYIGGKVSTVLG